MAPTCVVTLLLCSLSGFIQTDALTLQMRRGNASMTLSSPSWYLWSESKVCQNYRWYPNAYAHAGGGGGTSPGGALTKEQALESLPYCVNALAQDSACSKEYIIVAYNNGNCGCVEAGDDCTATVSYTWQFRKVPTSWYLWTENKACANQRWYPNAYAHAGGGGGTSPGGALTKEQALESLPYCVNALAQDSTCSKEWMIVAYNNGHCGCVEAGDDCTATFSYSWQFRNSDPPTPAPAPSPTLPTKGETPAPTPPCADCSGRTAASSEDDTPNKEGVSQTGKSFCFRQGAEHERMGETLPVLANASVNEAHCAQYYAEIVGSADQYPCVYVAASNRCQYDARMGKCC